MTKKTTKKSNIQRIGKAKTKSKSNTRRTTTSRKPAKTATKKSNKKPTSKTARKYKPISEPVKIKRYVTTSGNPIMIICSDERL